MTIQSNIRSDIIIMTFQGEARQWAKEQVKQNMNKVSTVLYSLRLLDLVCTATT